MTDNSNGVVILITLLNILVYKLQKLQEAQQTRVQEAQKTQLQEAEKIHRLPFSVPTLCCHFSLEVIHSATKNFSEELVIGKGGFGNVYKGIITERNVAIKRRKLDSRQGLKEFHSEIEMLTKFQHSHIVSLIGYCDDCEEMILVYEFMPCETLADHLYKRPRKSKRVREVDTSLPSLTWVQRLKICIGAAHGLDYLHTGTGIENRVIHRDIKTSNILLDENLAAKISDFGLSKTGPANQTCTYISTKVKGTTGYFDPYYFSTHRLTRKSDVYAFGIVLFEVLCGRRAVDTNLDDEQINIAQWAQHCFREGLLDQITDPSIRDVVSSDSLNVYVDVAIKCLHYQPKHRPTMAEVVVGLESALTLQRKSTQHTLVEILPIPYTDVVNCSIPEVKDTNHSKEYEFTAGGIINVSYNWQQKRQTTVRMTLGKRISGLLLVTARALSVKSNKFKATTRKSFLPVHLSVRRESWDHENVLHSSKLKSFTFNELSVATRKFNRDSVVGEGGFGKVYKGWVDENTFAATEWGTGLVIAVKKLHTENAQGHREWLTELNTLGNLCHPYVVRLIGYCSEKNHRLLVYDFMPQGSLDKHLFNYKGGPPLDWPIRCNIIKNIAKGVRYLHQGSKLIHRDLKASNILFDSEMNPRISDFGFARLTGKSKTELNTSHIVGTHGYMSPEYAMHGRFSVKSDVYSFGVLMLEIVTGTKNYALSNPHFNLSSHAWRLFQEEKCLLLLDKAIRGSCNESELFRAVQVGLLCVQEIPEDRPSMSMVVLMLSSDIKLPKPKQPGFSSQELDSFSGKEIDPYESETPHISFSTTSLFIPR